MWGWEEGSRARAQTHVVNREGMVSADNDEHPELMCQKGSATHKNASSVLENGGASQLGMDGIEILLISRCVLPGGLQQPDDPVDRLFRALGQASARRWPRLSAWLRQ